ncbi:hypothetical protein BHM03_00053668 [Ensete ventricosum]|nr:hypothetical protein BHM03_00053668 [Ensete ventricosum]
MCMFSIQDFGGQGVVLCGVFDGHGPHGHLVARKVRDALPLKLLSLLPFPGGGRSLMDRSCFCFGRRDGVPVLDPASSVEEPSVSVWREAFVRSSKAMDKELRSHPSLDCFCSGSTAVILLKLVCSSSSAQGFNLFVANIGDSRAVLGRTDENNSSMLPVQLTVDLKPDLPREAERIKKCRGRVFALQDEPEVSRVWLPYDDAPGLAMARAFGDFCLKDYGVISVPEFFHWNLTEKDQFVILASDGVSASQRRRGSIIAVKWQCRGFVREKSPNLPFVWDVLTNKDVVDIISSSPTRSLAAKVLVETAAREWKLKYPTSRMDDCAVVCLYLDGQTNIVSESLKNCSSSFVYSYEDSKIESDEAQNHEPTLDRNFTVRPTGNTRTSVALDEHGTDCVTEDGSWSGLEGVTRVNSIVQLPRFSDEKMHGDACL